MTALGGKLIVEIPEMLALLRARDAARKAFLEQREDEYRPPWVRHKIYLPRQSTYAIREQGPMQAVVIIGDRFSGNHKAALEQARQLYAAGTRVFICAESGKSAGGAAKAIAEAGGGTCIPYNPAVERIAGRLPQFFDAIGHYAIGGPGALEALSDQSATLLLEQIAGR